MITEDIPGVLMKLKCNSNRSSCLRDKLLNAFAGLCNMLDIAIIATCESKAGSSWACGVYISPFSFICVQLLLENSIFYHEDDS